MADTTTLHTGFDTAEANELRRYAEALSQHSPGLAARLAQLRSEFDIASANAAPDEAERAAETFARSIRAAWLDLAAHEASSVYRSPTAGEVRRMARHHDSFGYERDLQPEILEQRCATFFPPPPKGWRQQHVLFSSGQSAMTATLLAVIRRLAPAGAPLRLHHRGAYFETRQLVAALPMLKEATFPQTADVVIDEPVSCDGQFHRFDTAKLASASPRAVIFDTTLLGRDDGVDAYLESRPIGDGQIVLRVASCLKLLQGGFELANAGIVSIYTAHGNDDFTDQLRRVRTLTGGGIHLVDAFALEAPWVFAPADADAYASAIFDHNARLAKAVDTANRRFQPLTHPSFAGSDAPFCSFVLKDASDQAYAGLETEIEGEARRRRLNIAKGGSFGFRAHRFEIVKSETGDPPFLRIAMGRRNGWSCDGLIAMMAEIAAR